MERTTSLSEAKEIFGPDFIGPEELSSLADDIGLSVPAEIPPLPFNPEHIRGKSRDYLLILGISKWADGSPIDIISLRNRFGTDPKIAEPCFYNQDWYLAESFANRELESKWFLVRKSVLADSRAVAPEILSEKYTFPSAVLSTFTFFVYWHLRAKILWPDDFIWCADFDYNGDRIYVGRYNDISEIGKKGFNIHRHLSIRSNYGCADST